MTDKKVIAVGRTFATWGGGVMPRVLRRHCKTLKVIFSALCFAYKPLRTAYSTLCPKLLAGTKVSDERLLQ